MWQLPKDLRGVLDPDERIHWMGRPGRAPFVLRSSVIFLVLIPLFLAPLPFILIFFSSAPADFYFFAIVFSLIWYGVLLLMVSAPIKDALEWKNILYIITNKRAIVRRGLIGIDYDMLDLDLVKMVKVDVGFWDRHYGTGTITLEAVGVDALSLPSVKQPYEVQKIIRQAVEERNGK